MEKQSPHFVWRFSARVDNIVISVEDHVYFIWAFLLLLLPLQWVLALVLAVLVHECFHLVALTVQGGRVLSVRIGSGGIQMETDYLSPGKELVCALAGPVGSAVLLLLASWFPRIAICGMIHCLYNLLPLFPLDGGRILHGILLMCLSDGRGERCCRIMQRTIRLLLILLCLWGCFRWGIILLPVAILLLWRTGSRENCLTTRRFGGTIAT